MRSHLSKHINKYCTAVIFILAVGGGYLIYDGKISDTTDKISYFGFLLTSSAIFLTMAQFRSTQSWNKRHLATTLAREIKEKDQQNTKILNQAFGIYKLGTYESIPIDTIHAKICKKKENGEYFRDEKGKLTIADDDSDEGYLIYRALLNQLNDFEYLAVGINQDVFDEEMIMALYRTIFIRAYGNFKDYIDHFNVEMYPDRGGSIWKNFKLLGETLVKEDKITIKPDKRKGTI